MLPSSMTPAQLLSAQQLQIDHEQMSSALSSNLSMTMDDLQLLEHLQREQRLQTTGTDSASYSGPSTETRVHALTPGPRMAHTTAMTPATSLPVAYAAASHYRSAPSSARRVAHTPNEPDDDMYSARSDEQTTTSHTTTSIPSIISGTPALQPRRPLQDEPSSDDDDTAESSPASLPPLISAAAAPSYSTSNSLIPSPPPSAHNSLDRRPHDRALESALMPLTRRSQDRADTSLKGALRRTSLDLNTSISTLERQLTAERSKNARLTEQRKLLESASELAQRDAAAARAHIELLESQTRVAAAKIEEQRRYITEFETKFSIGGSGEEALVSARKRIVQLQSSLATAQSDLALQKEATSKTEVAAEEQRSFIEVIQRALQLRVQEINQQLGASTTSDARNTGDSSKDRILEGRSSRPVANGHPSAAPATAPLHITKYSLVEIAARACRHEFETQVSVAVDRQHEAEEALLKVQATFERQLDQMRRDLADQRDSLQEEFESKSREARKSHQRRESELVQEHAKKEQLLLEKARHLDASCQAKLEAMRAEATKLQDQTQAQATDRIAAHESDSSRVVADHRRELESSHAQLQSARDEQSKLLDYIEDLTQQLAHCEARVRDHCAQVAAAEQDRDVWKSQSQELEQTIEQMSDQMQSTEDRIVELSANAASVHVFDQQNAALNDQLVAAREETTRLEAHVADEQHTRRTLEDRIMSLECEVARHVQKDLLEGRTEPAASAATQPDARQRAASSYHSPRKSTRNDGHLSPSALRTPAHTTAMHASSASHAPLAQSLASSVPAASESLESAVHRARDLGVLQARLQHFEQAHAAFESRLQARDDEKQSLQARITTLEQQLRERQSQYDALRTQHDDLRAAQAQVSDDLARSTSAASTRAGAHDALASQHAELQARLKQLSSERQTLQHDHAQLQTAFALLQQELSSTAQTHAHQLATAHNEVQLVRHELLLQHTSAQAESQASFESQKRTWEDTIQRALESQIAALRENDRNRTQSHAHDLALARQQTDEASNHAHRLQQARAEAEEQANEARATLHDLRAAHEAALAQQRHHFEALLSAESESYAQLESKLHADRSQSAVTAARIRALDEMVESLKASVSSSHSDLLRAKEDHTRTIGQLEESRKRAATAAAQLETYQHTVSLLEAQLSEYKSEVDSDQRELRTALDATTKRLAQSEQATEKCQGELQLLRQTQAHEKSDAQSLLHRLREDLLSKEKLAQELDFRAKNAEKQLGELKRQTQDLMFELQTVNKKHVESLSLLREKESSIESLQARLTVSHRTLDHEVSKRKGFEEGLWAATSAAAHAKMDDMRTSRHGAQTSFGSDREDRRRRDDALAYVLDSASPVRPSRSPASESLYATSSITANHAPTSDAHSAFIGSRSSASSTFTPSGDRPISKVDERLKKIQSTFAKLKSDRF